MYPCATLVFGKDIGIVGSSENPGAVGTVEKLKSRAFSPSRLRVNQNSGLFVVAVVVVFH